MFEFIFDYVDKDAFMKYFRVVIIVGGYLFVRTIYSDWAKNKQIQRQLAAEEKEKMEKPEKEAKEQADLEEKLNSEAASFGWGKKTRKNVKLNEKYIEQTANDLRQRHQSAYDAAEDHDIDYLLEDD